MTSASLVFALILYSSVAFPAQAQHRAETLPGTTVDLLAMAFTDKLPTPTMFREVHLTVPLPGGGHFRGVLLLARDTSSQRFWWIFLKSAGEGPELTLAQWMVSRSAAYVADDKIVVFWSQNAGRLYSVERRGFVSSTMEEAQTLAMDEVVSHAAAIEKGEWQRLDDLEVPLLACTPIMFWHPPNQASHAQLTKVLSVARAGKYWTLVLRNQWDQEVVLDESYKCVSSRRLDTSR